MIPALFIRMSKRFDSDVNWRAALEIDSKDARSNGRKMISAEGDSFLMATIAASPFDGVLAARKIFEGLWAASWRIAS